MATKTLHFSFPWTCWCITYPLCIRLLNHIQKVRHPSFVMDLIYWETGRKRAQKGGQVTIPLSLVQRQENGKDVDSYWIKLVKSTDSDVRCLHSFIDSHLCKDITSICTLLSSLAILNTFDQMFCSNNTHPYFWIDYLHKSWKSGSFPFSVLENKVPTLQ